MYVGPYLIEVTAALSSFCPDILNLLPNYIRMYTCADSLTGNFQHTQITCTLGAF